MGVVSSKRPPELPPFGVEHTASTKGSSAVTVVLFARLLVKLLVLLLSESAEETLAVVELAAELAAELLNDSGR